MELKWKLRARTVGSIRLVEGKGTEVWGPREKGRVESLPLQLCCPESKSIGVSDMDYQLLHRKLESFVVLRVDQLRFGIELARETPEKHGLEVRSST